MLVLDKPICFSLSAPLSPPTTATFLRFKKYHLSQTDSNKRGTYRLQSDLTASSYKAFSSEKQFTTQQMAGSSSPQKRQKTCIWSSHEGVSQIERGRQIFCNRPLNMKTVTAVGFDMDYTLAQYKPETFECLAYDATVKKLVYKLNYPKEMLEWSFDWTYMVRGLVLDKNRGNILKLDRHKYVKVAYHGFQEMSKKDKDFNYGNTLIRDSFDEPDYAVIDTLFSLGEAYLFAQLVEFKDKNPGRIKDVLDYARMYKDVRNAVDLCHRDGSLKEMVAKDPKRYINEDKSIVPLLKMLKDSGRATFLVTNSAKPGFFYEGNRAIIFEVEPESGMLLNIDNGAPMPEVGDMSPIESFGGRDSKWKVFQGGNVTHLNKLLYNYSSSRVLYVGDHIYGDILRSKKILGWRTMLVVPELEQEVKLLWELRDSRKQLRHLRNDREFIEDTLDHLKWLLKFGGVDDAESQRLSSEVELFECEKENVRSTHQCAQREFHQKFHRVWGQLMKTGYQNSRFAHQVERFACLYTSQVSNLCFYSPDKYYRPSEDFMPHEFNILLT